MSVDHVSEGALADSRTTHSPPDHVGDAEQQQQQQLHQQPQPQQLSQRQQQQQQRRPTTDVKKLWISYILALPPHGIFGAHNYYLGRRKMAVIYTVTVGLFSIGWIVDLFRMRFLVQRSNEHLSQMKNDPLCLDDAYLTWFPLGLLGLHRFYLGDWIIGVVFLLTLSAFTFGWWFDGCYMKVLVEVTERQRNRPASTSPDHTATGETNLAVEDDENAPPTYSSIFGLMTRRMNPGRAAAANPPRHAHGTAGDTQADTPEVTDLGDIPTISGDLPLYVDVAEYPNDVLPEYSSLTDIIGTLPLRPAPPTYDSIFKEDTVTQL